jgi:hypothetical protein
MTLLEQIFFKFSFAIASNPKITIALSIVFCAVISFGLLLFEFENRPQKLWVAEDSVRNHQQLYFGQQFGAFFRINQLILRTKNEEDADVDLFQPKYLEVISNLQRDIEKQEIELNSKKYTVEDICFKPIMNKSCLITSPMSYWKMNLEKMKNDPDIKHTAKCLPSEEDDSVPCMDVIGVPIMSETIFGKQRCESGEVKGDCELCNITAKALSKDLIIFII